MTLTTLEVLTRDRLDFIFRLVAAFMRGRRARGDDDQARFWLTVAQAVEAALDGEAPALDFSGLVDHDVRVAAGVVQGLAADGRPRTARFFEELAAILATEARRRRLEVRRLEVLLAE
jgi:hypothetical protein